MPEHNEIAEAIKALRAASGESQQYFGAALRISTRALQLYEAGARVPEPRQLVALAAYAHSVGSVDDVLTFLEELDRQLAAPLGYKLEVNLRPRHADIAAKRRKHDQK